MASSESALAETQARSDRILPLTRVVAAVVVVILSFAWWAHYLQPARTDQLAWTIKPEFTAMVMGAGYGSAVPFYLVVLFGRRWHRVTLGFWPTTVFVWLLAGATVLHWDKFHHNLFAGQLWIWVYAITPILVPLVWLINRRTDPGTLETADVRIGPRLRALLLAAGVLLSGLALVLYVAPESVIPSWPWPLTPLTARTVAAFTALPGVAWLVMAIDRRWSAARMMVATVSLGLAMLMIGAWRAWSDFDHDNWLTYVYVGGLATTLAGVLAMVAYLESATRQAGRNAAPSD